MGFCTHGLIRSCLWTLTHTGLCDYISQLGNTSSLSITEVKQPWAQLVLGWETVPSVAWVLLLTLKAGEVWLAILFIGCWLCVDAELAIGQCRLGGAWSPLLSEQPLALPAEDVITGLEFLVDLPMWSFVDQQDKKPKKTRFPPQVHYFPQLLIWWQ